MQKISFKHIFIVIILFFSILTYIYYYETKQVAISNAHSKIDELLLNYQALRINVSKQQKQEIYRLQYNNQISEDYFMPQLLSSTYNVRQVNNYYNELRKKHNKEPIIVRFASDNPRNPNNKATKKESELLKKFNQGDLDHYNEIIVKDNKSVLYNIIPTKKTTAKCMRCHSDPSIAPKGLIDIYGDKNGFHEKIGQIRAALVTEYPLDEDLNEAFNNFIILTFITFVFFTLILVIVYFFMKKLHQSNKILDDKVLLRTLELAKEKEYIETIIESNNNAIIAIDSNRKITTYNNRAQEMFGWSKEEMIGTQNLLNLIPKKYKSVYNRIINSYLKKGRVDNDIVNILKTEAITKSGDIFPVRISIGIKFKDKDTILVVNIADITQEKRQEAIITQQTKLASMGEMIGNIAHQWRQPLSVISTSATGMKIKKEYGILEDDEFYKVCDTIDQQAQYLSDTIDDFRNFIQGDRVKVVFDLSKDINSFLHLVDGAMNDHNINVVLDLEDGIKLNGYPNELNQCLINLFNNSKDALDEQNDIKNKYFFISTKKNQNSVTITIKDNANGIPEDILDKIFEPYFTTKHKSQGTGLGLHMTYKLIVDGMGGTIEAHNVEYNYKGEQYKGAEFIITLPQ